jgi:hypothetical protein
MRILHCLPVYAPAWQFGGPVLSVSRLCEALVVEGVDVEVFDLRPVGMEERA